MVKIKYSLFAILILFFLIFSFYPTLFEISQRNNLADKNREFILEHNYYWPDFNLYLSKIRQGLKGNWTTREVYTSERHQGSLLQEFYIILGQLGRIFHLSGNDSYLLGRILLSPLLLLLILFLVKQYFKRFTSQFIAFFIVVTSGSFPRFYTDTAGLHVGRYMEWWSNIDALQRITFIPHILFGQITSFYLLYRLSMKQWNNLTMKQLIFYIILGNLCGLVFPPSLITLNSVLIILILIKVVTNKKNHIRLLDNCLPAGEAGIIGLLIFVLFSLPSLLYLFIITQTLPWSSLVIFHKTHPMMIPFWEYILGTGPIFFLGLSGMIVAVFKREKKFYPLIYWILSTFLFAILFTHLKEQSPLRFTQTGLFIPLGLLGAYFFYQLFKIRPIRLISLIGIFIYTLGSLFMMNVSLRWQLSWITQLVGANQPAVPYPPQAVFPLKSWMDGIRWLENNSKRSEIVLAGITAGNYIPAYSGNTVYFGQANTVDYEKKALLVNKFLKGEMSADEARIFLLTGRIKYIFVSYQEKELTKGKPLEILYPALNLKKAYSNPDVTIYKL